jgi:Icc-related predicted phosphoesterase
VRLFAISDLHVSDPRNRAVLASVRSHPDDWLIVAGDVAEHADDVMDALEILAERFAKVLWTPGNHELWTLPSREVLRGEAKYLHLVERCRALGVVTPEDPFPEWPASDVTIAPLFVLYDYSFRPDHVSESSALDWAMEADLLCTDEVLLHPDPYPSRAAWCRERVRESERRLAEIPEQRRTVLVTHFPLRRELVRLPRIPRFSIWCGTTLTESWHRRFRAVAAVSGHLHVPRTDYIDGVRFDEVSFGYHGQWDPERGLEGHLRLILDGADVAHAS